MGFGTGELLREMAVRGWRVVGVDASAAIYVDVHNTLVNNCVLRWGSPEIHRKYLPRLSTDMLGAFALSEPASGSDAFALACEIACRSPPVKAAPCTSAHQ